jgi:hypothetical protein
VSWLICGGSTGRHGANDSWRGTQRSALVGQTACLRGQRQRSIHRCGCPLFHDQVAHKRRVEEDLSGQEAGCSTQQGKPRLTAPKTHVFLDVIHAAVSIHHC